MAIRNLLHRNKLPNFIEWLGDRSLPPKGNWEVARWKGPKGSPMRVIYDNSHSSEHLSCNDAAFSDIQKFIRESKMNRNIQSEERCTIVRNRSLC